MHLQPYVEAYLAYSVAMFFGYSVATSLAYGVAVSPNLHGRIPNLAWP